MRSNARGSDASVTFRFVGSFSNASNTSDGSVVTRRVLSRMRFQSVSSGRLSS
jgi:hypothetical protein